MDGLSTRRELLTLHPRVTQQGISEQGFKRALGAVMSRLVPFRGRQVHAIVAALDWDHRLPSRSFVLRLHVCYDELSLQRLEQAFTHRRGEIASRNLFPEFDVPDFGGLPADETYDVDLTTELEVEAMRLTSPWRREVPEEDGQRAVAAVRASVKFAEAQRAEAQRPPNLGDPEAVAWTPPCESGQPRWTLDVWWLTSFDGRTGKGWSFLVDMGERQEVVLTREFSIRAG